jgi:hypothetical protein
MTTKTILKNDGIFVYEDYKLGRAALRIKELNGVNPAQNIRRTSTGAVEAVLVSAAWMDSMLAGYSTAVAPTYKQAYSVVADDYLGSNLSKMVDLINGHAQTKELVKPVAEQGTSGAGYLTYKIIVSAEWFQDQSPVIPFEESSKKAGQVVAYLMHSDVYALLAAAPVAGTYVGTGDGTLAAELIPGGAVAETITATATSATDFAVVGSVTGAMGNATVGTLFTGPQVELLITDGTVAFVAGDLFTFASVVVF